MSTFFDIFRHFSTFFNIFQHFSTSFDIVRRLSHDPDSRNGQFRQKVTQQQHVKHHHHNHCNQRYRHHQLKSSASKSKLTSLSKSSGSLSSASVIKGIPRKTVARGKKSKSIKPSTKAATARKDRQAMTKRRNKSSDEDENDNTPCVVCAWVSRHYSCRQRHSNFFALYLINYRITESFYRIKIERFFEILQHSYFK